MDPTDPLLRAICWAGVLLVIIIPALPIIKSLRHRKDRKPPQDHPEERNQAAAMWIASIPLHRRRVKKIHNLINNKNLDLQMEERNEAAAENIASLPLSQRVTRIYNLLAEITAKDQHNEITTPSENN